MLDSTNMPNEQELSKNINNSKKYGNANLDRHNGITSIMLKTTAFCSMKLYPLQERMQDFTVYGPRRSRTGTGGGASYTLLINNY
jgi:hypothetical protein